MECERKRCAKELTGRQKRWHSPSCRVLASRERNYRKIVRRAARRPVGERPLNARERGVVAAVRGELSKAASLYSEIFGGGAIAVHP